MRITKSSPAFAGSPHTVSYLLSKANLENFFNGTTLGWTGCCARPACCELTETAVKTTRMNRIDMPFAHDVLPLRQTGIPMGNRLPHGLGGRGHWLAMLGGTED